MKFDNIVIVYGTTRIFLFDLGEEEEIYIYIYTYIMQSTKMIYYFIFNYSIGILDSYIYVIEYLDSNRANS